MLLRHTSGTLVQQRHVQAVRAKIGPKLRRDCLAMLTRQRPSWWRVSGCAAKHDASLVLLRVR